MKRGVKIKSYTVFLIMSIVLLLMIPFGMFARGAKEPAKVAEPEGAWR